MKNRSIEQFNNSAKSAFEELINDYSEKIYDKIIEDAILKNKSNEDITFKDVLEAETKLESDKEINRQKQEKKSEVRNYMIITFALSINLSTVIYQSILKRDFVNDYFVNILLVVSSFLLVVLLGNSLLRIRGSKKNTVSVSPENIKWILVKQWSEIEKIVIENKMVDNKLVSPIEVIKFIQKSTEISPEEKSHIYDILKVRNEMVHSSSNTINDIKILKKYNEIASSIISKIRNQ
jgi:hypothetical protein